MEPDTHEPMEAPTDDNGKFCSLAFKLWSDPFVGKLVFFRVYSGTLSKGDNVYNPRTNKRERISRLIQIQADKREDIETCYSGDIAAIVGIKNITTGDTLCDEDHPILLEPPSFPDPVISMAIEPKTKLDQEKMGDRVAAARRRRSDFPRLHARRHRPDDHRRNGRAAFGNHSRPHVPRIQSRRERRQTADRVSRNHHRRRAWRWQIDQAIRRSRSVRPRGSGRASRNARGKGLTVENKIVGGNIPKEYIPAVQEGHRRSGAQRRARRLSR
jgi:elongation factor G